MSIKEDIEKVEEKVKKVEEHSIAMEILTDYKKANKRQFIIIVVILAMLFCTIGYLIYILNDIGEQTTTQEIEGIDTIENSNITNEDMYGQYKTN